MISGRPPVGTALLSSPIIVIAVRQHGHAMSSETVKMFPFLPRLRRTGNQSMRFQDPPGCFGSYVVGATRALPYEYAEWALARVGIDYHVEVSGFFYSVPHALIRQQVETRVTERTVQAFHRDRRVAAYARAMAVHGTAPYPCRVRIKFGMPGRHRWNPHPGGGQVGIEHFFQQFACPRRPPTDSLYCLIVAADRLGVRGTHASFVAKLSCRSQQRLIQDQAPTRNAETRGSRMP